MPAAGPDPAVLRHLALAHPHLAEPAGAAAHSEASTVGGCDDRAEFECAPDLLPDGLERLGAAEQATQGQ